MRKLILALPLALTLSACNTTGGGNTPGGGVTDFISAVQQAAASVCGFIPDDGVVSKLLIFFRPDAASALALAQQICSTVTVVSTTRSGRRVTPRLHNVAITGRYVR